MKALVTRKVEVEVEVKTIRIEISPRYIGDNDDDDVPTNMPLLKGESWVALVDIDTGEIEDWPAGKEASLFAKVCDAGLYTLLDKDGSVVAQLADYVPHGVVPGEWGDYVDLKINGDGVITNWPESPYLDDFFENDE